MTSACSRAGCLAVALLLFAISPTASGSPAVPPFEIFGFGAGTTGGYGGQRVVVTTLQDLAPDRSRCPRAPCSLRHAVAMEAGPRHITFGVSGTIVLQSPLPIWDSDVTIDGSTAPNGGVQIINRGIQSLGDNIVLTHLKLRAMDPQRLMDCLEIRDGSNIVVDHVSAQFCNDEGISASGYKWDNHHFRTRNVTIQHSLIGWSLPHSGDKGYSSLFSADVSRVSLYRNAILHNAERNPAITAGLNTVAGQREELRGTGQFEVVENIVYDYRYVLLVDNYSPAWKQEVDVIGNYFIDGSSWRPEVPVQARLTNPFGLASGPIRIYLRDNLAWSRRQGEPECLVAAARDVDANRPCAGWDAFEVSRPHGLHFAGSSATTGTNLLSAVAAQVGAHRPCRDRLDRALLADLLHRAGRNVLLGETVQNFGGLPNLASGCS